MDIKKEKAKEPVVNLNSKELLRRHQLYILNGFLNKYFGIFIIIVVIITFYFGFSLIIKDKYKSILVKINDNASIQNQVFPKYEELSNSKKLNDVYAQINPEDIERIKVLAPKEVSRQELFAEVMYILQKQGIKVSDLKITQDGVSGEPTDKVVNTKIKASTSVRNDVAVKRTNVQLPSGVGYYDIDLKLSEIDYLDFKRALTVLENNLRLMDVRSLKFVPSDNTANISLTTYYIKNSLTGEVSSDFSGPASELNLP